ncbi:hypothetical protein J18TS1_06190 [Oceanobacillus oncorhynchi subsp. incaldanensis]|nr:hypothetical protein J18TS1_06190 [Oceanobacillus oncorhynchi subsp. incaldanensis]
MCLSVLIQYDKNTSLERGEGLYSSSSLDSYFIIIVIFILKKNLLLEVVEGVSYEFYETGFFRDY